MGGPLSPPGRALGLVTAKEDHPPHSGIPSDLVVTGRSRAFQNRNWDELRRRPLKFSARSRQTTRISVTYSFEYEEVSNSKEV